MDERKPVPVFWPVVAIMLVAAYPFSFGPACWFASRAHVGNRLIPNIYRPVLLVWELSHPGTQAAIRSYARLGSESGWEWERVNGVEWRWVKFRYSDEELQRQREMDRPKIERLNTITRLRVERSLQLDPPIQNEMPDPDPP